MMAFFNQIVLPNYADTLNNSTKLFTVILVFTIIVAILINYIIENRGVPPGPIGVPVFGYWPFLKSDRCHQQLLELKKKYGDIFSFRLAGKLYINLASSKILREAHVNKADCFEDRTTEYTLMGHLFENSLLIARGEKWNTFRKFFVQQFKERGVSLYKENTAEVMHEFLAEITKKLKKNPGKPKEIHQMLAKSIDKICRKVLFDPNTGNNENEVINFQEDYRKCMALMHSTNMILVGSIAKHLIFPFIPTYNKIMEIRDRARNFLLRTVQDHQRTFDGKHIRDIVDSYIKERNDRKSRGDTTAELFTDETLAAILLQSIGDASFSGATYICFFLKSLVFHPVEQEKIYKELMDVCGGDRNLDFYDKSKLPYTNAFLLETERLCTFVHLFPRLECTRETTLGGYKIPKGSITVMNIYSIHNDPETFENPEIFYPERFLTKEVNSNPNPLLTFGVAKRVCIGESFVRMLTFLFCATLVKNFRISCEKPKTEFELMQTREFELFFTPRK